MPKKSSTSGERGKNVIDLSEYRLRRAISKPATAQRLPTQLISTTPSLPTAQFVLTLYVDGTSEFLMTGVHQANAIDMVRAIAQAVSEAFGELSF